jgi:TAT (twin-arginine translocation) pathway signal sequence
MNRRSFLKTTSAAAVGIAIGSTLAKGAQTQTAESPPTFAEPV